MAAILPPPAPTILTDAQNGGAFTVPAGSGLDVRLAANASTGYSWQVVRGPPGVAIARRPYRPGEPDGTVSRGGAPGEQVFGLRILAAPGDLVTVELAYKRPGRAMAFGRVWLARLRVVAAPQIPAASSRPVSR